MEDILVVNKFYVKSNLFKYQVKSINNVKKTIDSINGNKFLLVDNKVMNLFKSLNKINLNSNNIVRIRANEKNKEFSAITKIISKLLKKGIKKNSILIVIGGGITQDIGGFISSILFRGIQWFFFPTTLLAQGDSCIGSKTSINFKYSKNQIGTFYPPSKIFLNEGFLLTLKKNDLLSGLGEMSHYFIIGGKKAFELFEKEMSKKLIDYEMLIFKCLRIKRKFIEKDEFDKNQRNILNYGHTFGHAIETVTNYKIPHGVAVSIGIDLVNHFSVQMGYMNAKLKKRINNTLKKIYRGYKFNNLNIKKIIEAIKKDKKSIEKSINLILSKNLERMFIKKIVINKKFEMILNCYFENLNV